MDPAKYKHLRAKAGRMAEDSSQWGALTEEEQIDLLRLVSDLELAKTDLEAHMEELRRVSRELEAANKAAFELFETAPVAMVILTPKSLIQRLNAAAREMLSPNRRKVLGYGFSSFIHPEDRHLYFRSLQSVALEGGRSAIPLELRMMDIRGRLFHTYLQIMPQWDAEKRSGHWRVAFFDITGQKNAEAELYKNQRRLRSVLEHSLDVSFRRNLKTERYEYLSPIIETLTGYSVREMTHISRDDLLALVHPEDRPRVLRETAQGAETGQGRIEFRFKCKNGSYRWMGDFFTVQTDTEGNPTHRTGVLRDITNQKQTEAMLEEKQTQLAKKVQELSHSNEELSEYAYAVAHDLKAPFRALRNYADFLNEDLAGSLSGDQQSFLKGMKQAVEEGETLINDLLDYSRIGETPPSWEEVELDQLVQDVARHLPRDVQISVDAQCRVPADRLLLKQILSNLMGNAVKFNDASVKQVQVGCRVRKDSGIELYVKDNGIGIDERFQEQIFRVFQRLHPPSDYTGTGIGLAIVKKAARLMDGDVRLESSPGQGSTFFIDLPAHNQQ